MRLSIIGVAALTLAPALALPLGGCSRASLQAAINKQPDACLLNQPSAVRSITGDPNLNVTGEPGNKAGGSRCVYRDGKVVWLVEDDSLAPDPEAAFIQAGYRLAPAASPELEQSDPTDTSTIQVVTGKGQLGVMYVGSNYAVTVIGPKLPTAKIALALLHDALYGYGNQVARGVGGQ